MRLVNSKRNILLSLATLLVLVAVTVHFLSPGKRSSATGSLSLSPVSSSINTSQNLIVTVKLNTDGLNVYGVQANLKYPTNIFGQVDVAVSPSFKYAPQVVHSGGVIKLGLGTDTNASVNGQVDVATLTFHPIAAGTGKVTWDAGTEVQDQTSTDIGPAKTDGSYVVTAVTPPPSGGGNTGGTTGGTASGSSKTSTSTNSKTSTNPGGGSTTSGPVTTAATTAPIISDLSVTGAETGKPVVTWKTDVASTSAVEYGTTTNYGMVAATVGMTTDHSVALDGSKMTPNSTYYVRASSASDEGNTTMATTTIQTPGSSVTIEVRDWLGNPVSGATVKLGDKSIVTGKDGKATFTNVKSGSSAVSISYKGSTKTQNISVKSQDTLGSPQKFMVQASNNLPAAALLLVLAAIVVGGGGFATWHYRSKLGPLVHEIEEDLGVGSKVADSSTGVSPVSPTATPGTTVKPSSSQVAPKAGSASTTKTSVDSSDSETSFLDSIDDIPAAPRPGEITHPPSKDE